MDKITHEIPSFIIDYQVFVANQDRPFRQIATLFTQPTRKGRARRVYSDRNEP